MMKSKIIRKSLFLLIMISASAMSQGAGISTYLDSLRVDSTLQMFEYATNKFVPKNEGGLTLGKAFAKDSSGEIGRLYYFAAYEALTGRPCDKVIDELTKRERFYLALDTAIKFLPSPLPSIGDSSAPIKVVAFVSGTCPVCKRTCSALYDAITGGNLRGKVFMTLKPAGQSDADPAMIAAAGLGDFWDYFTAWQAVHGEVDHKKILKVAAEIGFDKDQFEELMTTDSIRTIAADSRREALRDGMEYTPSIFINGRRYDSSSRVGWVIDAIDWEFSRISALSKKK